MNYHTFIDLVGRRAGVEPDTAADLCAATLEILGTRLTGGEATDLAAQLPQPLQRTMRTSPDRAERFGAQDFVQRVARRAEVDEATARDGVRAVLRTVEEAVTGGEFEDVVSQLPTEFRDLVAPEPTPEPQARRR